MSYHALPNEATVRCMLAVLLAGAVEATAASAVRAQNRTRYLYVAEVQGTWAAVTGRDTVRIQPLARVDSTASFRLLEGDEAQAVIVLRDPITLTRYERRCEPKTCSPPILFAELKTQRTRLSAQARVGPLYADLGNRDEIRERIRLVGARGNERELGIIVLARRGSNVDLREIMDKLDQPRDRLLARFCSLTDTSTDPSDCIEGRTRRPGDCDLSLATCEIPGSAASAYRVDIYVRERSMLGSVAVASGFAAIVSETERGRAVATRDSLSRTLKQVAEALVEDEIRGLTAAATIAVAGAKR